MSVMILGKRRDVKSGGLRFVKENGYQTKMVGKHAHQGFLAIGNHAIILLVVLFSGFQDSNAGENR
jgi:hypothetical protein